MSAGLEARWGQFLFGGLAVFLITQMHGVPFKRWHKIVFAVLSIGGAIWYYMLKPDRLGSLPNTILTRYVAVVIMVALIWLIMRPFIWSGKLARPQ